MLNPWVIGTAFAAVLIAAWKFGSRGDDSPALPPGPVNVANPSSEACDGAYTLLSMFAQDSITQAAAVSATDGGKAYFAIAEMLGKGQGVYQNEPYPARLIVANGMKKTLVAMQNGGGNIQGACRVVPTSGGNMPFEGAASGDQALDDGGGPAYYAPGPTYNPNTANAGWVVLEPRYTTHTQAKLDAVKPGSLVRFMIGQANMPDAYAIVEAKILIDGQAEVYKVVERWKLDPGVAVPLGMRFVVDEDDLAEVVWNPPTYFGQFVQGL